MDNQINHDKTPACLLACAHWVLDIEESAIVEDIKGQCIRAHQLRDGHHSQKNHINSLMDPGTTKKLLTIVSIKLNFRS